MCILNIAFVIIIYYVCHALLNWVITLYIGHIGIQAPVSYTTDIHVSFALYFLKAVFQNVSSMSCADLHLCFDKPKHPSSLSST